MAVRPGASEAPSLSQRARPTLGEFAAGCLRLGVVGFGGGVTVLAAIHDWSVTKKGWLTEREFTNAATLAQMMPGGAAANALAYLGMRFDGMRGALLGYGAFVLPGFVSVVALAWVYERLGNVPTADTFLLGLNAAVVGIIAAMTLRMLRNAVQRPWQAGVTIGALVLTSVGSAQPGEVIVLAIGVGLLVEPGLARLRLYRMRWHHRQAAKIVALPNEGEPMPRREPEPAPEEKKGAGQELHSSLTASVAALVAAAIGAAVVGELLEMTVLFFRMGLGAYGGGFTLIPALHTEMMRVGWVTDRQFADAVAVGKLTPGPVLLMATFIGFLRHGVVGAVVATIAIFAGPFLLTTFLGAWLNRMRSRWWVRAALRGLTPAVVGLMASAGVTLAGTLKTPAGAGIAAAVMLVLIRFEVNPVALLLLAGAGRIAARLAFGI